MNFYSIDKSFKLEKVKIKNSEIKNELFKFEGIKNLTMFLNNMELSNNNVHSEYTFTRINKVLFPIKMRNFFAKKSKLFF